MQASVTAPDVQARRTAWKEQLTGIDQSHLVYLDECGVNTDMTRIPDESRWTADGEKDKLLTLSDYLFPNFIANQNILWNGKTVDKVCDLW